TPPMPAWPLPEPMREAMQSLMGALDDGRECHATERDRAVVAERLLIGDEAADVCSVASSEPVASLVKTAHERLEQLGIDPMQADIEAHYRWIDQVAKTATTEAGRSSTRSTGILPVPEEKSAEIHGQDARATGAAPLEYEKAPTHFTEKLDAILIHKVWGLLIFAAIMSTL